MSFQLLGLLHHTFPEFYKRELRYLSGSVAKRKGRSTLILLEHGRELIRRI